MLLEGTIKNGAIVLDQPQLLQEGARVRVNVEPTEKDGQSLRDFLLKHAGTASGLPRDLAEQHDHYLHGTPKR